MSTEAATTAQTTTESTPPVNTPAAPPAGEKLYAGKFKSVEELEKSYVEAQKLISKKAAPATPTAPTPEAPLKIETSLNPEEITFDKVVTRAGLDLKALEEKYTTKGSLDDEDYAALSRVDKTFNRHFVNSFAEGQVAKSLLRQQQAAQIRGEAAKIVGGEEQLNTLLQSAPSFVPPDEIDDINARLQNPKSYKGALRDLMDYHAAKTGGTTRAVTGTQSSGSRSLGAKDASEYSTLMRLAANGDEEAAAKIRATPLDVVSSWGKFK